MHIHAYSCCGLLRLVRLVGLVLASSWNKLKLYVIPALFVGTTRLVVPIFEDFGFLLGAGCSFSMPSSCYSSCYDWSCGFSTCSIWRLIFFVATVTLSCSMSFEFSACNVIIFGLNWFQFYFGCLTAGFQLLYLVVMAFGVQAPWFFLFVGSAGK